MDVLYAIHDCALGLSPVTSYSGVKRYIDEGMGQERKAGNQAMRTARRGEQQGHASVPGESEAMLGLGVGPASTMWSRSLIMERGANHCVGLSGMVASMRRLCLAA